MISNRQQSFLFILSYLGWFGCVFAGKYELGFLSYLVPITYIIAYSRIEKWNLSFAFVFSILFVIGISFDALAISQAWIVMVQPQTNSIPPHWLISLWLLFAFSVPMYNEWLKNKYWLAGILGFFIGPLTYFSGVKLGVLQMDRLEAFLFYALFWCLFFPFCFKLYSYKRN